MILSIHPVNPQARNIQQVVDCLLKGGVIIYPTDTIYGLGCVFNDHDALQRVARIKNVDLKKAHFSILCSDLSDLSLYTRNVTTPVFRVLKKALPGPYTFILEASKEVPKILKTKRSTIGIRVPDYPIIAAILEALGKPIISTSLPTDVDVEYFTDAEIIYEAFGNVVDMVIDGGIGGMIGSTVVDCTTGAIEVIREGAGDLDVLEV